MDMVRHRKALGACVVATVMAATLACANAAEAVQMGSAGSGEAIALEICSDCHVASDRQVRVGVVGLPSFRSLANDPAVTEIWFRTYMRTPHFEMPNYVLTDEQLDDVWAYIHSLKE